MQRINPLGFLSFVFIFLQWTKPSWSQNSCSDAVCPPLENCIQEQLVEGSCCPSCAQFGCPCEGYQYYDCVSVGFQGGKVPEGESYFVDFGSTECTCPPGGGRISCHFIPCPELPPNCIDVLQPADGCVQCGRIGCVHGEEKYEAGHTFHMSHCKFCHCPNTGGELMCYAVPECHLDSTSDPERQYDYPYSHEQDPMETVDKNNNYKRNALQDHSVLDYEDITDQEETTLQTSTEAIVLVEHSTPHQPSHPSTQTSTVAPTTLQKTKSGTTMAPITSTKTGTTMVPMTPTKTKTTMAPMTPTETGTTMAPISPTETGTTMAPISPTETGATMAPISPTETGTTMAPMTSTKTGTTMAPITTTKTRTTMAPMTPTKTGTTMAPMTTTKTRTTMAPMTSTEVRTTTQPDIINPTTSPSSTNQNQTTERDQALGETLELDPEITETPESIPDTNEEKDENIISRMEKTSSTSDQRRPGPHPGPQVMSPHLSERGPPKDIMNQSRPHEGSSRDVMESCCAAGQQWSMDHGECENLPLSASPDCRLAERQCCVSYLKDNTCIAGMIAAKEDGICLQTENDQCERSHFKLCCDCCSLGLKIRKEGESCESHLSLGFPCGHMMLLCCSGDEQLLPPETRTLPKPEPTPRVEKDIDECALNTHTCGRGERCLNTDGSFLCVSEVTCQPGFILEDGVCQDINECAATPAPCKPSFTCINTLGSYVCQRKHLHCNRGYRSNSNGSSCTDIDECAGGAHNCSAEESCYNLPGSYRCDCKAGYRFDAFRRRCLDVNECWAHPGRLCHHTCDNTVGSYRCSCFTGFRLGQDGKHCEDVNECEQNPCNQECTNIYGSYQCYCKEGYKLGDDGTTCQDIDECRQSIGSLCTFACVNTPGSYQCACPERGYTMSPNGLTCKDIDECEIGTHNCSTSEECYNIQGGHKCLAFTCPENYRRVSNMQCERIGCHGFQDCQNSPVRISYHRLTFPSGVLVPAQMFRISPSPVYAGDNIIMDIKKGNEENYFSVRKLNAYTGILYLQRPLRKNKDFLLDVEMRLYRQGSVTSFLSRIYIFITAPVS
ncbi:fibulin-2-like [Engystomops pustulosus]|uniref:fibulin-2-like n=1 Tax=Engystomops pustulosus TaxID=76066 RepID=UPI003AFB7266